MTRRRGRSTWRRDFLGSTAVKLLFVVPSAATTFISLRFVTSSYDVGGLALFSLIASIPTLLPFSDLGLGGTLTQAVASHPSDRSLIARAHRSIFYRLAVIGLLIGGAGLALQWTNTWSLLLGSESPDAALAATISLLVFACTLPLALGYRLLLGLQQNTKVVLLQSSSGVIGSIAVTVAAITHASLVLACVLPVASGLLFSLVGSLLARRAVRGLDQDGLTGADSWRFSYITSAAFLLISISAPITFQTDRVLLANLSTVDQLAQYAIVFQMYGPANALLIAAGQTLWPRFAAVGVESPALLKRSFAASTLLFASFGAAAGAAIVVVGPLVAAWVSDGVVQPSLELLLIFGVLITVNAALYPAGMLMVGGRAVRVQAVCALTTAGLKVVLALTLFAQFGALGMVLATVTALTVGTGLPVIVFLTHYFTRVLNPAPTPIPTDQGAST